MDKTYAIDDALADLEDGAVIAVAGFGYAHNFPATLIDAVTRSQRKKLCVVANSLWSGTPASPEIWVTHDQVSKMIVSFSARPGLPSIPEERVAKGEIELEMVPQGILVDRLRAVSAGIRAFYTRVGADTELASGREIRLFDGVPHLLEEALPVEYALLRGHRADKAGNIQFRGASSNFGPPFAKAARVAVVEVDEIVEIGEIAPEDIHLPGIFVSRVVQSSRVIQPDTSSLGRRPPESRRHYLGKPALSRGSMAACAANLIPDGSYVNLGTGLPNFVASQLEGRDVWFHGENGILGYGPRLANGSEVDPDMFDAGGGFVSSQAGMSFFDSVVSFEIARSGRLDAVVLGGYQVDGAGSLANWRNPEQLGGGIGGAMDLVVNNGMLIVLMEHCDRAGNSKLVSECTYPVTGQGVVDVVITDLGLFRRGAEGFVLERVAPGFSPDDVLSLTEFPVTRSEHLTEMTELLPVAVA